MVEGARLESVYTSKGYRGFESLSLRKEMIPRHRRGFLFLSICRALRLEQIVKIKISERSERKSFPYRKG